MFLFHLTVCRVLFFLTVYILCLLVCAFSSFRLFVFLLCLFDCVFPPLFILRENLTIRLDFQKTISGRLSLILSFSLRSNFRLSNKAYFLHSSKREIFVAPKYFKFEKVYYSIYCRVLLIFTCYWSLKGYSQNLKPKNS